MVVIRLARHGAHKAPFYRIVVADQRKKRDGRIIEQVGTYDPLKNPSVIDLDVEKVDEWIAKGAQPSDRVAKIISIVKGEPLPSKLASRIANKEEQIKKAQEEAAKKAAEEAAKKAAEEAAAAAEAEAEAADDDAASEDEAVAEESGSEQVTEEQVEEAAKDEEAAVEAEDDAAAAEAEEAVEGE